MSNVQKLITARNLLVAYIEDHERSCQAPMCEERANAIAFLAHAVGITPGKTVNMVVALLAAYLADCDKNDCIHVGDTWELRQRKLDQLRIQGAPRKPRPTDRN